MQGAHADLDAKIADYDRAIELDPNFARAYASLATAYYNLDSYELAEQFSETAWSLRDRVSEREQFYISWQYYQFVQGDMEKGTETLELWARTYPRDYIPFSNLANNHASLGQFEKSVEETRAALQLNPQNAVTLSNLVFGLLNLNRYDEAQQVAEQALAQKLDNFNTHASLRALAFIRGDRVAVQQQDDWSKGKPVESAMLGEQAATLGLAGQLRQAREATRRAIEIVEGKDNEIAGRWAFISAMREAAYGNCVQAKSDATRALALARNRYQVSGAAVALALCGEATHAQQIADDVAKRFPKDAFIHSLFRPGVLASTELVRNNPRRAIELLEPARRYELGTYGFLWPAYLRGLAYLQQQDGTAASREWQKLLDHKGFVIRNNVAPPLSLAQLGHARALALIGDTAKARQVYEELFALWKDADAELAALLMARQEYERLK